MIDIEEILTGYKIIEAFEFSGRVKRVLDEVQELLPYLDVSDVPETVLTMLDTLNLSPSPTHGKENLTAYVYLIKAFCHYYRGDSFMSNRCVLIVEDVPEWKVLINKKKLVEIKEIARLFKENHLM